MSYINFVDHPRHGRVWYVVRLLNWRCLGRSAEDNRARGPLFELEVPGTLVSSGGATLEEAERDLQDLLGTARSCPGGGCATAWASSGPAPSGACGTL